MMVHIVKIPCDETLQLTEEVASATSDSNVNHGVGGTGGGGGVGGDAIPHYLQSCTTEEVLVDTTPLIRLTHPTSSSSSGPATNSQSNLETMAGLYVYSVCSTAIHSKSNNDTKHDDQNSPNIRATRLAMACGWHSQRFVGDVYVGRLGYVPKDGCGYVLKNLDLSLVDIAAACLYSPDVRATILESMKEDICSSDTVDDRRMMTMQTASLVVPNWLENASQRNYHDGASIAALAVAMTRADLSDDDEDDDDSSSTSSSTSHSLVHEKTTTETQSSLAAEKQNNGNQVLTEITLCLHCRGPASSLCEGCGGAYFCDEPRRCKMSGCVLLLLLEDSTYRTLFILKVCIDCHFSRLTSVCRLVCISHLSY